MNELYCLQDCESSYTIYYERLKVIIILNQLPKLRNN